MLLDDVMSDSGIGVGFQAEQCGGAERVVAVIGHDIQQHGQGFWGGDFAEDLCECQALARVGFRVGDGLEGGFDSSREFLTQLQRDRAATGRLDRLGQFVGEVGE